MIYVRNVKNAGGYDSIGNRYIIVELVCDDETDLPNQNYFISAACIIAQCSTAEIITTGNKYEMKSDGTWVLKRESRTTYTTSEIDSMLSARMPFNNADYIPLVTNLTWDLFNLPVGTYYRSTSISDVLNIPSDLSSAFFCVIQNTIGSNRRQILLYPCTQATAGVFYRCLETASGFGNWYKFTGAQV